MYCSRRNTYFLERNIYFSGPFIYFSERNTQISEGDIYFSRPFMQIEPRFMHLFQSAPKIYVPETRAQCVLGIMFIG